MVQIAVLKVEWFYCLGLLVAVQYPSCCIISGESSNCHEAKRTTFMAQLSDFSRVFVVS